MGACTSCSESGPTAVADSKKPRAVDGKVSTQSLTIGTVRSFTAEAVQSLTIEQYRVDIPDFSFDGCKAKAHVAEVYDGDTLRLRFGYESKIVQWRCRLDGIDAPEMKPPKSSPTREQEKKAAALSRDELAKKLGCALIDAHFGRFDKYGRPLVRLYVDGVDVNQWMIDNKFAVAYDGGKKGKVDYALAAE